MTTLGIASWIVMNVIVTYICWNVLVYANTYLFTYLGTDDDGKQLFMYHALTIPARCLTFGAGILAILIFEIMWASFIGVVIL